MSASLCVEVQFGLVRSVSYFSFIEIAVLYDIVQLGGRRCCPMLFTPVTRYGLN